MDFLKDEISRIEKKISEAKGLQSDPSVPNELKDMAKLEVEKLEKEKEMLSSSLHAGLIESEDFSESERPAGSSVKTSNIDPRRVIIEIRAGAGGDEAGLFAGDLYRMYTKFVQKMGWKVSEISKSVGGIKDVREVVFEVVDAGPVIGSSQKVLPNRPVLSGTPSAADTRSHSQDLYSLLKFESGVHRVQRVPVTESGGRIHTSTATVAVLPVVNPVLVKIDPSNLKIDTYRSSGAGGQSVNKVETAVRITHIPTGIAVACQDERSQLQNKERAMNIIKSKLFVLMQEQQKNSLDDLRLSQIGTGDRSEKIRTYNYPQNRITDHRIKKSWHNLEYILEGNLDPVLKEF